MDADCVGLTKDIPQDNNAAWLDLLAGSGTRCLYPHPDAVGPLQTEALTKAFAVAAGATGGDPSTWQNKLPTAWQLADGKATYSWAETFGPRHLDRTGI